MRKDHCIFRRQDNPALVGTGLLILASMSRQPGNPGLFSVGPVALRPHLSMGLPFRSLYVFFTFFLLTAIIA